MTYGAAMGAALRQEMERDERIFLMGEDIELSITGWARGLFEIYGPKRVRNTPISESTMVGTALGAAATGMHPVVDLMLCNFTYVAMDQLLNQAAKLRYMMGGSASFPMTVVAGTGAASGNAAQHSDNGYPMFMNAGGLKVVVPSTPEDAKGLFTSALRDSNPVLFFWPGQVAGSRSDVPDGEYVVPLGVSRILREGSDLTIVGIGAMAKKAMDAAEELNKQGVSAEVIDPRTLHPLDHKTIVESVGRTGRLLVVDEARATCSAGSEVIARVSRFAFSSLRAAPRLIAVADVPIPFNPLLEKQVLPSVPQIVQHARELVDTKVTAGA
jgi:pyruvate dehydrogenase E1 component beta subunit